MINVLITSPVDTFGRVDTEFIEYKFKLSVQFGIEKVST